MARNVLPPCQVGCPVRTDAGGYARLVAQGRYEQARQVICRTNPFPSVCAHICQRPCEKNCRRAQLDAPVALRALKRFVIQRLGTPEPQPPAEQPAGAARVAVVGAGPAGLTAALDLRRRGHPVCVFERLDRPGGMLNVIPRYRLPQEALDADVEAILGAGIELRCGTEVGRDLGAGELLERGYDAVVVATGLSRSRGIAVPGFGAQRFTAAIPWMTDVWLGNRVDLGHRVAVIGGGNVAVDVARTARRLGADHVALICLESREEMPAEPEETALAEAEGIRLLPRQALKRVINRDGRIVALELMAVLSVFDDQGRFRPTYDPARVRTLAADMVVLSIGQAPDRSWARGFSVRTDERGRIVTDRETQLTSHPRVFLAGEALRGPGSAIEAVADGHRVAEIVGRFLDSGDVAALQADERTPLEPFPDDVLAKLRRLPAADTEARPFAPAEPSLDEAEARREGGRCLGCLAGAEIDETRCAACLTCFRVCPLDAVEIGEDMVANPVRCQACGLCAAVCPANAIDLAFWPSVAAGEPRLGAPRAAAADGRLALVCQHANAEPAGASAVLAVPCLARLRPVDVLRLFAQGYAAVALYPCARDECKYGRAWENIQSLADAVGTMLSHARPAAKVEVHLPQAAGEGDRVRAGGTP
ncbi:MAG: FAD-dependent oxidoreductase [Candidatus Brocadiia bacterium]